MVEIGDTLTQSEFNRYISYYRKFVQHRDILRIDSDVTGEYGKYEFDIKYGVTLDNGILLTGDSLTAQPKIKLSNNTFKNSTYTITLKVIHYENVSIFDDETDDNYKVVDELPIQLTPNTWTNIPLTDIEAGYIISFDTEVVITHDKTEIQGNYVTGLNITTDKSIIQTGDTATITITATDLDTLPVSGKSIQLYDGGTLLDNLTTNSNGVATKTVTGTGSGRHSYLAQYKSSVQSLSTEILDAYFYDQAITGHKNTNWTVGSKVTVGTPTNDGTELTISDATTSNSYQYTNTTFSGDFEAVVYIDNPSSNEAVRLGVVSGSTRGYVVQAGTEKYWKLVRKDGTTTAYYSSDGVTWTSKSMRGTDPTGAVSVYIGIYNNTSTPMTFTYKDFIVAPIESGLALTSNKSVLSYYDSETATLTATFSDGAGATVELYNASDDTLIATMNDEGDGTYSYTYNSVGVGDIGFYAKTGNITSDTITIEDCIYYDVNEVSYVSSYTSGDHSIKLDSNFTTALPSNCEISMDVKSNINGSRLQLSSNSKYGSSTSNYGFGMNRDGTAMNCYYRTTSSNTWGSTIPHDTNYHNYKFVKNGTSVEAFLDNTSKGSQTFSWIDTYTDYTWIWWVWKNGTITAKNIKIKAL